MSVLATGVEVWSALCSRAGAQIRDYDRDLERKLAEALGLHKTKPLVPQMEAASVDATRFLEALFRVAQPFVDMFRDILVLAEEVAATQGRQNLDIRFDFGGGKELKLDLDAFRAQVARLVHATRSMRVERWTNEDFFKLARSIAGERGLGSLSDPSPHPHLAAWVRLYNTGTWPDLPLPPTDSGSPSLDALLDKVFVLHRIVVDAARRVARDRDTLHDLWPPAPESANEPTFGKELHVTAMGIEDGASTTAFLRSLHSDHWARTCACVLYECADRVRAQPDLAASVIASLNSHFAGIPTQTRNVSAVVQEWEDILRLPIWNRRSELYSIWIFTQIVGVMRSLSPVEFGFENGLFDVPFSPKRLATIHGVEPTVHLWSEVRTPLTRPRGKGRERGVQPDFILTTQSASPPAEAFGVVEAKQYRKQKPKPFADALADYAEAHPRARVLLVDYGPTSESVVGRVEKRFRARTHVIGSLFPRQRVPIDHWRQWAQATLNANCAVKAPLGPSALLPNFTGAECVLRWSASPRDLDLHVRAPSWLDRGLVNFEATGSLTEPPWLQLDKDVRDGYGPEQVRIEGAVRGSYRIAVHRYSDDGDLAGSGARVELHIKGLRDWAFACPTRGSGIWWHVCDVDFSTGIVREIGVLSEVSPFPESK